MTIEEALEVIRGKVKTSAIKYAVQVDNGFVFAIWEGDQPLYVTKDGVRGLNGNMDGDREIIQTACEMVRKGDYY